MGWTRYIFPVLFFLSLAGVVYLWTHQEPRTLPPDTIETERRTAVVRAVERVAPTVVSISSYPVNRSFSSPLLSDMQMRELYQSVFPHDGETVTPSLGSGIVIDSRGFFLTNDHLVGDAGDIFVSLPDGRQFEAEVVGTDPKYDLAVIKVANQDGTVFETSPIGNSSDLLVGEWVVAVGNPYGYLLADPNPSVTVGVVSALHRDIRDPEGNSYYKDMIQTDASINPGNSGGPLVNTRGEVIGINTFIFTRSGVSLGLGFAIPINTALQLAGELILYGRVRGVWVGIAVRGLDELSPAAMASLNVKAQEGVMVWTLERGSPAQKAGLQLTDVIRSVNGEPVTTGEQAQNAIFGARVGDTIVFQVERKGETLEIPVTLQELPVSSRKEIP